MLALHTEAHQQKDVKARSGSDEDLKYSHIYRVVLEVEEAIFQRAEAGSSCSSNARPVQSVGSIVGKSDQGFGVFKLFNNLQSVSPNLSVESWNSSHCTFNVIENHFVWRGICIFQDSRGWIVDSEVTKAYVNYTHNEMNQ
jgi:hypothetical protein